MLSLALVSWLRKSKLAITWPLPSTSCHPPDLQSPRHPSLVPRISSLSLDSWPKTSMHQVLNPDPSPNPKLSASSPTLSFASSLYSLNSSSHARKTTSTGHTHYDLLWSGSGSTKAHLFLQSRMSVTLPSSSSNIHIFQFRYDDRSSESSRPSSRSVRCGQR